VSRAVPIEVHTSYEIVDDKLAVIAKTMYRGEVMKTQRHVLDVTEDAIRRGLIALGWTPPAASVAPRTVELERELTQIASMSEQSQWPMLSHIDGDRFLIGGTVNAKQLAALAELAQQLGDKA
jgi:hypothetical protein